jgi:IS4 transposase
MITTNQADRILNRMGSKRYYKRLEVEELTRLLTLLAEIEISNLGDEYFINKQQFQVKAA